MNIVCELSEYNFLNKLSKEYFCVFPAKLSIGHLFSSPECYERKAYLKTMINKGFDSTEYLEELETDWGLLKKSMKELEEIPPEEDVFIWLNLSPDSLCILYYLVNFFHNKSNNLFIISLPAFQVTQKSANSYKIKYCYYWDDYKLSKKTYPAVKNEFAVQLSPLLKRLYLEKWGKLIVENCPIRTLLNGQLIGVGEDFFDSLILFQLKGQIQKISRLISNIHFLHLFIPQWWIEGRIKFLIEKNLIEIINPYLDFYNRLVKIKE